MGIEYNIRFTPPDLNEWETFVARLHNPIVAGWPAFTVELRDGIVYFCDHGKTKEAAAALRQIIDEGLLHNQSVVIEEA